MRWRGSTCSRPTPVAGYRESLPPAYRAVLDGVLQCSAIGDRDTVARGIADFVGRTGVDEVMVSTSTFDHGARKRSLAITADAVRERAEAA